MYFSPDFSSITSATWDSGTYASSETAYHPLYDDL